MWLEVSVCEFQKENGNVEAFLPEVCENFDRRSIHHHSGSDINIPKASSHRYFSPPFPLEMSMLLWQRKNLLGQDTRIWTRVKQWKTGTGSTYYTAKASKQSMLSIQYRFNDFVKIWKCKGKKDWLWSKFHFLSHDTSVSRVLRQYFFRRKEKRYLMLSYIPSRLLRTLPLRKGKRDKKDLTETYH